jgi:hypothetical protein
MLRYFTYSGFSVFFTSEAKYHEIAPIFGCGDHDFELLAIETWDGKDIDILVCRNCMTGLVLPPNRMLI